MVIGEPEDEPGVERGDGLEFAPAGFIVSNQNENCDNSHLLNAF